MNISLTLPVVQKRASRIAVAALFFLAGLCFSTWASRIPHIQTKLSLNNAELGGVLLALPVGLLISLPLAGWFVSRFGSRIIVITAALLYAICLPFLGLAGSTWQLVCGLFVFGLCGNLLNISVNTQAVGVEALYGKTIMASFHGVWSLAGFSGAAIGTLMISSGIFPFQHFYIIAGLALLIVLIASRYTLPVDTNKQEKTSLFVRPDKSILKLGIIAFCCMTCEGAMVDWSGVYFQKVVQAESGLIALGFTSYMFAMASGRFIADWLTTKLGIKRILQISGLVIASGLSLAVLLPYIPTAIVGFLLVGFGVSSVVPLVYSAAGRSAKLSPGVALAAVSTIGYLGFLFGPPFIGFIAEAASLRVSFILIALLGLTTTLIATRTKIS
ncbi:MAG TPA: MFS transporter [Flavitalea sp.]|nr:MFS transporter [Flavitalea sp.]